MERDARCIRDGAQWQAATLEVIRAGTPLAGNRICATGNRMRKTVPILIVVLSAMLGKPLQLPAASCILSNAPDPQGCKMNCCANKGCCALSQKNKAPARHPLVQDDSSKQPLPVL